MYLIQNLTDDVLQKQNLVLPDGSYLSLTLNFIPMQYGWFIKSLVYKNFTLQGFRVFSSPNLLQQYMNQLPFGLACFTIDNNEPHFQKDFTSGYATLYILSKDEVISYQRLLSE